VRTTSQIVAALHGRTGDGRSLAERLCRDCAHDLDLTGTALSLADDEGLQAVLGASGAVAEDLEKLQFELGEGPTVTASRDNEPSLHPFLDHTAVETWPGFAPAALEAGIRAVFALPLRTGAVRLGALGLYRATPGPLSGRATSAAFAYADAAVVLFLHLQAGTPSEEALHAEMEAPLERNAEVHQATGFLSVTASVGVTEALLMLRAHAFASERPLLQVARDVLAGRLHIEREKGDDE
jgi:hypothetical protein